MFFPDVQGLDVHDPLILPSEHATADQSLEESGHPLAQGVLVEMNAVQADEVIALLAPIEQGINGTAVDRHQVKLDQNFGRMTGMLDR